jgi:NADPH:quinone reductase-like Zn-dependent oxidoreductase
VTPKGAQPLTLVTGAAGRVGGTGRTIAELLFKQGKAVRAMVRSEDQRAQALRDKGAYVAGDSDLAAQVVRIKGYSA